MSAIGYNGGLFNPETNFAQTEIQAFDTIPSELKLRICLDLDLLDIVRLRAVSRSFKQLVDHQKTAFVHDYQENFEGLSVSPQKDPTEPSTFYTLIHQVQYHTAFYHQKRELIRCIGSLSKMLTLPVCVPEHGAYKTLKDWIDAQTTEDWKKKPDILRVQGQHFEIYHKTESLVIKYSLFLPRQVQRGAEAVDQIWKGYLYTESNALSTGTYLNSDLTHNVHQLFNENYKSWDFISYLFCGTIPKNVSVKKNIFMTWVFSKFFKPTHNRIAMGYFTKINGHSELNARFQAFINGQPLSFFNNLPEPFKKSHPYLEKIKIVLGWNTEQ